MIHRNDVISVSSDFTLAKAISRMEIFGHRALPVVDFNRYKGVIELFAIYEHIYIKRDVDLEVAEVSDVMRSNIQVVYGDDFVEHAATAFRNHRYQFLPVLMNDTTDQFMGIIPVATIMNTFASALGLGQPAHRLTVICDNVKGELARLTRALYASGANITSLATVEHTATNAAGQPDPRMVLVVKFEGDLESALISCRAQGAIITHVDRYEG